MLKYKLSTETQEVYNFDSRHSFVDLSILNISKYLYSLYQAQINLYRVIKQEKSYSLKNLNKLLITKKNVYKQLLASDYNPNVLDNVYIILKRILGIDKIQAMELLQNSKEKYRLLNQIISNINNDIKTINEVKKDLNKFFVYYDNFSLYYNPKAKITIYDLQQLKKGILTSNLNSLMYFYIIKLKKVTNSNVLTTDDILPLFKSLFNCEAFKNLIDKSTQESIKSFTTHSIISKIDSLRNEILNKWL